MCIVCEQAQTMYNYTIVHTSHTFVIKTRNVYNELSRRNTHSAHKKDFYNCEYIALAKHLFFVNVQYTHIIYVNLSNFT